MSEATLFQKTTFLFMGISSLIGWNAVLNSFSFFQSKFSYYDVSFWFPVPLMFANFIFGPFMPILAEKFSTKQRVVGGITILLFFLILLVVVAVADNTDAGFAISLIITFCIGTMNSISQNTLIAVASQTGGSLQAIYWIGTGVSGLCMNFFSMIAIFAFGEDDEQDFLIGTIFYYFMAIIISGITIYCFTKLLKEQQQFNFENKYLSETVVSGTDDTDLFDNDQKPNIFLITVAKIKMGLKASGYFIPLFIWLIYEQTFIMFPGVTLKKSFNSKDINVSWGILILLTSYNLGDIVGKYLGGIKIFIKKSVGYTIVLTRFIFFFFLLIIATNNQGPFFENDALAVLVTFLFATTNGFATSIFMILGSMQTNKQSELEVIGFISGFMLTLGISCGTFSALIFKKADQWNW